MEGTERNGEMKAGLHTGIPKHKGFLGKGNLGSILTLPE